MTKKEGKKKERNLFLIYNYCLYYQGFLKMMEEALN